MNRHCLQQIGRPYSYCCNPTMYYYHQNQHIQKNPYYHLNYNATIHLNDCHNNIHYHYRHQLQ